MKTSSSTVSLHETRTSAVSSTISRRHFIPRDEGKTAVYGQNSEIKNAALVTTGSRSLDLRTPSPAFRYAGIAKTPSKRRVRDQGCWNRRILPLAAWINLISSQKKRCSKNRDRVEPSYLTLALSECKMKRPIPRGHNWSFQTSGDLDEAGSPNHRRARTTGHVLRASDRRPLWRIMHLPWA